MNPYFDSTKPHHRADGFVNSDGSSASKPLSALLQWFYERWRDDLPPAPSQYVDGYAGFSVDRPDVAWLKANHTQPAVTWIGHATLLVQMGGINVLTDPHFSERTFAVQWAGPKRRVPLPMQLAELPHIDLVLISHNHYDHLDRDTVRALNSQAGGAPLFAVPLGVERWLREQGITNVQAFDWWDQQPLPTAPQVAIHSVPAHHWSSRTATDRNRTLWGGWVVQAADFSFYFAGDTGYSADFTEIGRRFPGLDLAAIPVGAYEPRWFMKTQHVNPPEAVQIHQDLGVRRSIGVHWGTFDLTDEPMDAPIGALPAARDAAGVAPEAFMLLRHGQTMTFEPTRRSSAAARGQ
ncbi:MAG: MBL fold metallo-hydrolase [Burkholderiaceae bacterium]